VLWLRKFFKLSFKKCLSLLKLVSFDIGEKNWFQYLIDRENNVSFLLQKRVLALTKGKIIVDLGSGSGKISEFIDTKQKRLYLVDNNYWLMYLAKICGKISNDAICIISDLETLFPFTNNCFDIVMSADCLMYIDHQKNFLKEIKRIVNGNFELVMTHIHAKGMKNLSQGNGLNKIDFGLFGKGIRIIDDRDLWQKLNNKSKKYKGRGRSFSVLKGVKLKVRMKEEGDQNISYQENEDWR
jgi:ubiquinone/menaquinone biosynthesis C-methylase UbiE